MPIMIIATAASGGGGGTIAASVAALARVNAVCPSCVVVVIIIIIVTRALQKVKLEIFFILAGRSRRLTVRTERRSDAPTGRPRLRRHRGA